MTTYKLGNVWSFILRDIRIINNQTQIFQNDLLETQNLTLVVSNLPQRQNSALKGSLLLLKKHLVNKGLVALFKEFICNALILLQLEPTEFSKLSLSSKTHQHLEEP